MCRINTLHFLLCTVFLLFSITIAGQQSVATFYLSKFKWGHTFLDVNRELLDQYAACTTSAEVVKQQNDYLCKLDEEANAVTGNKIHTDSLVNVFS